MDELGSVLLTPDILAKSNIALWALEIDDGSRPRLYVNDTILGVKALSPDLSPEEIYQAWFSNLEISQQNMLRSAARKMIENEYATARYIWNHPCGKKISVVFGGTRNLSYTKGIRLEGFFKDITSEVNYQKGQMMLTRTILSSLGEDYELISYINLNTNKETIFKYDDKLADIIPDWQQISGFEERCKIISELLVFPEDKEEFIQTTRKDVILKELETKRVYLIYFRISINGKIINYQGKFVLAEINNVKHIIAGFHNADKEIKVDIEQQKKLTGYYNALASQYFVLYYLDFIEYKATLLSGDKEAEKFKKIFNTAKSEAELLDNFNKYYVDAAVIDEDKERVHSLITSENVRKELAHAPSFTIHFQVKRNLSNPVYIEMSFFKAHEIDGKLSAAIMAFKDVDKQYREERETQEKLAWALALANTDPLTRVKSRAAYEKRVEVIDEWIETCVLPEFGLVVCDVNGLKKMNDTAGHEAGDKLLCSCAKAICSVYAHSPVYRIGGDEFLVLLQGNDYNNRESLFQKLEEINESDSDVSFAYGQAVFDSRIDKCANDVFVRADKAMYQQKNDRHLGRVRD